MTACDRAKAAYERADRRADVLRNRWETLQSIAERRVTLRRMKDVRKKAKEPQL